MEELLLVLLEFFFEVVLNVLISFPWDLFLHFRETQRAVGERPRPITLHRDFSLALGGAAFGFLCGLISIWLAPSVVLPTANTRVLNLLIAPFMVAFLARAVSQRRKRKGSLSEPQDHFWFTLGITGAFLLVRFYFARR